MSKANKMNKLFGVMKLPNASKRNTVCMNGLEASKKKNPTRLTTLQCYLRMMSMSVGPNNFSHPFSSTTKY